MFSAAIKEHTKQTALRKKELDRSKAEACAAVEAVTAATLTSVTQATGQVQRNQKLIDEEVRKLHVNTNLFAKHTGKWVEAYKELNEAIKELGDVRNWAKVMENDMTIIANALDGSTARMNAAAAAATATVAKPAALSAPPAAAAAPAPVQGGYSAATGTSATVLTS